MKKIIYTTALVAFALARASAAYIPVALTGFNNDVIADGIGNASASTTIAVDLSNWNLVAPNFQATSSSSFPAAALPASGLINSVATSGLTFQLAGYSANNALVLSASSSSGTLNFSTAVNGNVYVLGFTGNGPTTANITVNFTDNTSQSFTSLTFNDWYGGSGFAIQGIGRVNRTSNVLENPSGDPRLYQILLSLSTANSTKQIASITVTKTSSTGVLNILAVSVDNVCTSPSGVTASVITGNSATANWSSVSGSVGYEYIVDLSPGNPTTSGTFTTATSVGLTNLNTNTTYYVHVRNKCTLTYSNWTTGSFTTLNTSVTCNAQNNTTISNLTASTAKISWNAVAGTQGYDYIVDQTAIPSGTVNTIMSTNVTVSGLTGGSSYYAHVRNVCTPLDKSNWVNLPFSTLTCTKPVNVLISNITDSAADVLWTLMPNAKGYEYAVDFSNLDPTTGIKSTTGITTHLTALTSNTKYYIHIRSLCFTSDASDWRLDSFITKMVCYAPSVQVNKLGTNNPYAYWAAIPTAIAYEYALTNYASDPAFGTEIYNTFIDLTLPEDGKDYYVHVRAKCNSMFTLSQWSTVALRTGTTGISAANGDHTISIYPNPVKDALFVKGVKNAGYSITDLSGRTLSSGKINEGEAINTSQLSGGLYFIHIVNNGLEQQFRFVK